MGIFPIPCPTCGKHFVPGYSAVHCKNAERELADTEGVVVRLRTERDHFREALEGLLSNIKMHHDGECPGITPGDCLDAIYESAEVARAALSESKSDE